MKAPSPITYARPLLFWYQVFSLLALTVLMGAVGGLGLVWLRQQMTSTATRIQMVQKERVQVDRRLEFLGARIAELQRPDVLHDRAVAMGLTLRLPAARQIVRLGPLVLPTIDPALAPDASPVSEPYRQTFDLAVMEPLRPVGR